MTTEVATLAGGCFWCLEAVFQRVQGVKSVLSGYMGGHVDHPDYKAVCTGETGHAEILKIEFDPAEVSFEDLLEVYFTIHDPTTLNRQGDDVGTQYRSEIFYQNAEQEQIARTKIAELTQSGEFSSPIVTKLTAVQTFWPAEDYHHNYFNQHPNQPYCMAVVSAKVRKLLKHFPKQVVESK
ncbi:peptide-methionine (S)-S-oxide reductase MsrA [Amantichitinum ursilacus]|uniref:Peptide methionine sulfoxide reductase MsrA n=1 Tax=Amantichitinum ursilacus TaxID=857265 RepID=A0A0N0GR40_9NEIS|nr:peptide-methionine (S)-S-oxide reductase MsrA [Amantichitinum ursilacus]KPC55079.1 Peptide methionine sulfoxide reductase MsrA [Amantichitinum ursilacus]